MFPTNHLSKEEARRLLIAILQLAYSGERAAAYAYRGHWKSVSDTEERARIKAIEDDEWHHRELISDMLAKLKATPDPTREMRALIVGRILGVLCHLTGWLVPMYGAGKLESRNIVEYETAARYARQAGCDEFVDCLLTMAEVEWDHEKYFRARVLVHPIGRRMRIWTEPPAKELIRQSFAQQFEEKPEPVSIG